MPRNDEPNTDDPSTEQVEQLASEVERLQARRDELAAEAAVLDRRVHGGRVRSGLVTALVLLSCISFLAAGVGVWVNRNLLQTDVWVDRVGPLASDPAVQTALAAEITAQTMSLIDPQELFENVLPERGQLLAVPLAGAVENFVGDKVLEFVQSDTFARLWTEAHRLAHADAVAVLRGEPITPLISTADGAVVVSIVPAIDAVLRRIATLSPEILGRTVTLPELTTDDLPEAARAKLGRALGVTLDPDFGTITVYEGDALSTSQQALRVFDKVFPLMVGLTVVLSVLALVVSRRRRRTALQLLAGFTVAVVLVRRGALRVVSDVEDLVKIPTNKAATTAILDAFTEPLLRFTAWMLAVGAVAVLVLLITGPYPWARTLRSAGSGLARGGVGVARGGVAAAGDIATADSTVAWLRRNAVALQWGGGVAFVAALWFWDLSWLGLLLLAAVIGAFELWLTRLQADAGVEGADTSAEPPSVALPG